MKASLLVVLLCLAVGCGPDFTGVYSGTVTEQGPCSDGTSFQTATTPTWMGNEANGAVEFGFVGACAPLLGTPSGNLVTVPGKTCQSETNAGTTYTPVILDGTLTLNGRALSVLLHEDVVVSGAATGGCTVTLSGTLMQQ